MFSLDSCTLRRSGKKHILFEMHADKHVQKASKDEMDLQNCSNPAINPNHQQGAPKPHLLMRTRKNIADNVLIYVLKLNILFLSRYTVKTQIYLIL